MYTREIQECPKSFVKHKKPVFGTFKGHPEKLDIRGVFRPYGTIPLPVFITNLRIKSRLSLFFTIGEFIGFIEFFDAKISGMAEVCFWNKNTKQRYCYRSVMGPRRRFVPHKLDIAATSSYKKSRYIRISWNRAQDKLSVVFNLSGDEVRPSTVAAMSGKFSSPQAAEITCVSPAPTTRRCSAHYFAVLPLHGAITLKPLLDSPKTMPDADGCAFLDVNRIYMKFRSIGEFLTGTGIIGEKQIAFRVASDSQDAVDQEKYNGNVLFYDGKETPLPPVVITHHYGITKQWVIQDTENMVDLTFTPISDNMHIISVVIAKTEYHTIYGTLDGALLTATGEKIALKAFPALIRKYNIRL